MEGDRSRMVPYVTRPPRLRMGGIICPGMHHRPLTLPELGLLLYLLRGKPGAERLLSGLHQAVVAEINPAGAGSLRFVGPTSERRLGVVLGSTQFLDEDGVPVLVSLYLDQHGELYELDCWKTDESPLRRIPAF